MNAAMKDESLNATIVEPRPAVHPQRFQTWRDVLDNPWLMLGLLFFVTAVLGLPFLWISRAFTTRWKIILTFAVLAWTALIFWGFFVIMAWCYTRISDAISPPL